jgi:hypothetical protein
MSAVPCLVVLSSETILNPSRTLDWQAVFLQSNPTSVAGVRDIAVSVFGAATSPRGLFLFLGASARLYQLWGAGTVVALPVLGAHVVGLVGQGSDATC